MGSTDGMAVNALAGKTSKVLVITKKTDSPLWMYTEAVGPTRVTSKVLVAVGKIITVVMCASGSIQEKHLGIGLGLLVPRSAGTRKRQIA